MQCYKEFPRSIGLLTTLASVVYLMAGSALMLHIGPWFAAGFVTVYAGVHYWHYPRSACVNCVYNGAIASPSRGNSPHASSVPGEKRISTPV